MATARKAKADPFLTLEIPDVGSVFLADVNETVAWIEAEQKSWAWALSSNPAEIGIANHERRDQTFNVLNAARDDFARLRTNPSEKELVESGTAHLNRYFAVGLASSTPRAKFINSLRSQGASEHIALAALATALGEHTLKSDGNVPHSHRHLVRQGRTAMTLFDLGVNPKSIDASRAAYAEVAADNKQVMADLLAANSAALEALKLARTTTVEQGTTAYVEQASRVETLIADFASKRDELIKRLDDAHAQYKTAMELQAPVEYWNKKAAQHKSAAFWWGIALFFYALFGTVALGFGFTFAYRHAYQLAVGGENKFNHLLVLMSAGLLAGTTISFWVGRFLQRLFISERHMAIDAKLRSTMAQTYLALASNQHVDQHDRALVLAPLFRPSSDGLITEDKEHDGVAAVLSKLMAK